MDESTAGDATPRRRGRPALTGRALVLGGVVLLMIVVLASPVKRYFGSRSDVHHAAQQLREDRSQLADLRGQAARYADPGYIQQQARERLQYAMPGDTVYVVVDQGHKSDLATSSGPATDRAGHPGSWSTRLWASVRAADR